MMKSPLILCCMVLLLPVIACQRDVEIALPPHESRLVANAFLVAGDSLQLYISRSVGIVDRSNPADRVIGDARVTIFQDGAPFSARYVDTVLIDTMGRVSYPPAHYYSRLKPAAGHRYELHVAHDDFEPVVAATYIPAPTPILQLQFVDNAFLNETGEPQFRLSIAFSDPPGEKNHYHLLASLLQTDTVNQTYSQHTLSFDNDANIGKIAHGGGFLFDDELLEGQTRQQDFYGALPPEIARVQINGRHVWTFLQVELRHTSREYFDYQLAYPAHVQAQQNQSGFFQIDPVQIPSNVEGGYGIFAGYAAVCDTLYQ